MWKETLENFVFSSGVGAWATELQVAVNPDVLNISEAKKAIEDAGKLIGVCEYRPRFGRFEVAYV